MDLRGCVNCKRHRTGTGEDASVLVVTLVITAILGITLASYISYARTQHLLVVESQAWNAAMAYAEAGIEEGLGQANATFGTNYSSSAQTNWGWNSGGYYGPKTFTFTNGSYSAIIVPSAPGPTIYSTGYTIVPLVGRIISRTIRVTTTADEAFGYAITVRSNLTAKGTTMTVDSYDSADPLHSTNGFYYPPTRKAGADINSTEGFVNIQNAEIHGKLRTGPEGAYSIINGSVGDLSFNTPGQIQQGWYESDFNADFKDVMPPYDSGLDVTTISAGNTKTNFLGSGDFYHSGDFEMSQNEYLYVAGPARYYVTGNFTMKSQNGCAIIIAPGASLKLYVGTLGGPDVAADLTQVNTAGNASTFMFFGLPSTKTINWVGNNTYMGTVYAPQAVLSLGGGGASYYDYQGAIVCLSVSMNGHFNVHYDENLKRIGLPSMFIVTSWREI
jgi:hypothetical protein